MLHDGLINDPRVLALRTVPIWLKYTIPLSSRLAMSPQRIADDGHQRAHQQTNSSSSIRGKLDGASITHGTWRMPFSCSRRHYYFGVNPCQFSRSLEILGSFWDNASSSGNASSSFYCRTQELGCSKHVASCALEREHLGRWAVVNSLRIGVQDIALLLDALRTVGLLDGWLLYGVMGFFW